jgi:hypothetical protein
MKKTIITLLTALLLLPTAVSAQYKLIIRYANGTTSEKNIWDVDSIYFEAIADRVLPSEAPAPAAVDLGLTVKWANMNLGATSETESGWLVGWGDITGQNESKNLKWYPVLQPTADIVGFGNDIIKKYWATDNDPWRMPTDEELQELIDNCQWTWDAEKNGFTVSGNNNSIFLPAAGSRDGSAVSGQGTGLYYWSGTLSETDNTMAKAMMFSYGNGEKPTVGVLKRYMGCALRAVYGEPKINVSVSSSEAYDIGINSVKVMVQLGGSYTNYTGVRVGLIYGNQQILENDPNRQETPTQTCTNGSCEFTLSYLTPDVPYWYCAFVEVNGQRIYQTEELSNFATTLFPEPEYVDLGLSVKWATFNVGATKPEESGRYIGWGDPTGLKESMSPSDYGNNVNTMNIGFNPNYDTPYHLWGKKWRMPTRAEFEELYSNTTVTFDNNTRCNVFTAANGNSIAIPYAGLIYGGTLSQTKWGWYWTAESDGSMPYYACLYDNVSPNTGTIDVTNRLSIRAVYAEATSYHPGTDPGTNPGTDPGTDPGTNPSVDPIPETPVAGTPVDLGLSVKWANCNVGSTSQNIIGDYLTWGATEMQEQYTNAAYIYGNSTDIGGMKYLGTPNDPEYQAGYSYSIAGTQYDAAHVRWGGTWRMPTQNEILELTNEDNCTWTWTSRADTKWGMVYGYEVKSKKNGNSIFLPAAGRMIQEGSTPSPVKLGDRGYYWSDHVFYGLNPGNYNRYAYVLEFRNGNRDCSETSYIERSTGLPIRPVQPK